MSKKLYRCIFILLVIVMAGCAKRGTITGGPKDSIAPVLMSSLPKNFSTNFEGKTIRLNFDEYVKLKDVNKQLIVSPPMNITPEVGPTNASRYITIKIKDTLQPNTTYSFNFGQSIQDNNEGIPLSQFKYVFSTGTYIDSLSIEGKIKDARELATDNFVNVMLYEINDKYNDSVIYKDKPRYITNTLDSTTTFKIENIKAGNYLLVALKDKSNNFKFDPKSDKIGFHATPITIPTTEKYELKLFSEVPKFNALKPVQAASGRFTMGYDGNPMDIKTEMKNGNETIPTLVTRFPDKDSVNIWFKPIKADSVNISVSKDDFLKDFTVKLKNQKRDSLTFSPTKSGKLGFRQTFGLKPSVPLVRFDQSKMTLINKDSVAVPFTTKYNEFEQRLDFDFKKEPSEKYVVRMYPGAMIDFFERENDTLTYKLSTGSLTEYGNLTLTLKNVRQFPIIVELTDSKGKILATEYSENSPTIVFDALEPNKFSLRVIYDENKNGQWDPGSFLEKRQAEDIIYYPGEFDVRSNWDVVQDFDLGG